jgi:hypothetical protein
MAENFLSKALADGKVFMKTVNMATQLSKLKLEVSKKRKERERLLREIGLKILDLYLDSHKIDAEAITRAVSGDLQSVQQTDQDIEALEAETEKVKADFRSTAGTKSGGTAEAEDQSDRGRPNG